MDERQVMNRRNAWARVGFQDEIGLVIDMVTQLPGAHAQLGVTQQFPGTISQRRTSQHIAQIRLAAVGLVEVADIDAVGQGLLCRAEI